MLRKVTLILLVLGFILELTVLGYTIVASQQTLAHGKVYRFLTKPVDPYDAFRGRYVRLGFAVSEERYATDQKTCDSIRANSEAVVVLGEDEAGFAEIADIRTEYPVTGDSFTTRAFCQTKAEQLAVARKHDQSEIEAPDYRVHIVLPFNKFYANEYQAPQLEAQARENEDSSYLSVRVRAHRAVPEALHVGE